MASVPLYMYATQADDILVNLFARSDAEIDTENNHVTISQDTNFPWDGKVTFTVTPDQEKEWALRLRIPGWASEKPVPTDLYSYTKPLDKDVTLRVNGSKVTPMDGNGYATINRTWKAGDKVEIEFPMEVRRVKARPEATDDNGKLAIQRGPIMYCLEGIDQPDTTVFNKFIPDGTKFTPSHEKETLGGVTTLSGLAQQVALDGTVTEVPFKAIPYATWNNRGNHQMAVWIPEDKEHAWPTPEPTIASRARTLMIQAPIQKDAPESASVESWAWGVNDQWEPRSSSDISKPYHYWWLRQGTEETLAYAFDKPETVSSVDVYWLEFDHYDGNYRVPSSWKLYYKDTAGKWLPVEEPSGFGVEKDKYNHVDFKPVETTGLKLAAQLQPGESGGVIEWKVN